MKGKTFIIKYAAVYQGQVIINSYLRINTQTLICLSNNKGELRFRKSYHDLRLQIQKK